VISLLKRSGSGTSDPEYLARYISVGGLAVGVDVICFQALIVLRVTLPLATTLGFLLGTLAHFLLNKLWTFRVDGPPRVRQIAVYATVLLTAFAAQQFVIETLVLAFHTVPIAAKIIAVVVQLPVSFFGHRYLTFREGPEPRT
jgi:putative flippase GtrA